VLFVFAAPLTSSSVVADARDCALKQYASIDLEESTNGHPLIAVTIDGIDTLMLLNTDTIASTLTDTAVSRLGLKTHSSSIHMRPSTGQPYFAQMATVKMLALGSAQFQNTEFMEIPTSTLSSTAARDYADKRVVGVIGMDILANMDIELDIAHHKMNLYAPDHCPGQVVYWSDTYDAVAIHPGPRGEFYFPIELDGKKIEATLSTFQATTT
jgi:predicted aspartyl protease